MCVREREKREGIKISLEKEKEWQCETDGGKEECIWRKERGRTNKRVWGGCIYEEGVGMKKAKLWIRWEGKKMITCLLYWWCDGFWEPERGVGRAGKLGEGSCLVGRLTYRKKVLLKEKKKKKVIRGGTKKKKKKVPLLKKKKRKGGKSREGAAWIFYGKESNDQDKQNKKELELQTGECVHRVATAEPNWSFFFFNLRNRERQLIARLKKEGENKEKEL